GVDAQELDKLAPGELGVRDHAAGGTDDAREREPAVTAGPGGEGLRMPKHRDVMNRDDEWYRRVKRRADPRAVEDVDPTRTKRQQRRVPDEIAERARAARERQPANGDVTVTVELGEEPLDVSRRTRTSAPERRHGDADAKREHATSVCSFVSGKERTPGAGPCKACRVRDPARDELLAVGQRLLDARGDRLGAVLVDADGGVAARLVERGVRRDDARDAARHCLDHRDAEAFESGGVDEDVSAAVEARELVVGHIPE